MINRDKMMQLLCCGWGPLVRRDYAKGALLLTGFWMSCAMVAFGFHADGLWPLVFVPVGGFLVLFIWIYNALDVFDSKGPKLKKSRVEQEWQELYHEGVVAYLRQDYDAALQAFRTITLKNNRDADVYFQLGKVYYKKHDAPNAVKMFETYLNFDVQGKWDKEAKAYLEKLTALSNSR